MSSGKALLEHRLLRRETEAEELGAGLIERRAGPLSRASRWWLFVLPPVLALVGLSIALEAWLRLYDVATYLVPRPSLVYGRLAGDIGFFLRHGGITLGESLAGFGLGSLVAFTGAMVMAYSRMLERTLFPLAIVVKVTPIVAVAPLFVIWFGFGSFPKILIAGLITFFPVLVNAMVGLRAVNNQTLDFFRSLNASGTEVFLKLRLPSSLPYLFAAFRIALPLSVIGAVVGEWFSGDRGLGSVIIVAHSNLDTPTLFAAIIVLAVIGIGLTIAAWYAESRLLFWHESSITT
jgi:NitT/TauT family transport system permease protein